MFKDLIRHIYSQFVTRSYWRKCYRYISSLVECSGTTRLKTRVRKVCQIIQVEKLKTPLQIRPSTCWK